MPIAEMPHEARRRVLQSRKALAGGGAQGSKKRPKRAHQARLESLCSKNPLIGSGIASINLPQWGDT